MLKILALQMLEATRPEQTMMTADSIQSLWCGPTTQTDAPAEFE